MSGALTFASFSENMNIKRVMRIFYSLSNYSTCHFLCSSKIFLNFLKACPKWAYNWISKRAIKDRTNQISYLFFQKYFLPNLKVLAYNFFSFFLHFFSKRNKLSDQHTSKGEVLTYHSSCSCSKMLQIHWYGLRIYISKFLSLFLDI